MNLYELHHDLPFLPKIMKIEKGEKPVANLHDKNEYVIRIRNLKQPLNQELVLKNVRRHINLDYTINKYKHRYHSTTNMQTVNVKSSKYINFSKENNEKNPKFKVDDHVTISNY